MKDKIRLSSVNIVLVVVLIWLGALTFSTFKPSSKESWRCSLVNCTKVIGGDEWAKDNCFLANNQEVCRITVNGVNQLIPKQSLNLTAIQQCVEYKCIEETRVKSVNYVMNITT